MPDLVSRPASALQASDLHVPGDKSITHRALILAALAEGRTDVQGWLDSADCRATLDALRACGVRCRSGAHGVLSIEGAGLKGLSAPRRALDFGNSGTGMRLMSGVLCAQEFSSILVGDASLSRRPMERITEPLRAMGANIRVGNDAGGPPLHIEPAGGLHGIDHASPLASAQVKSCLMLAGLYADGPTTIRMPSVTRDHTERMMETFGARVASSPLSVTVRPGVLRAARVRVPGDFSSAAFFIVAASIVPGSDVVIKDLGVNPTRTAALDVLLEMGADVTVYNRRYFGAEPVADVRVRSADLRGVDVPRNKVAVAVDEFPVLFIAAAVARGITRLRGASELRVKESDRIAAMARGLEACGVKTKTYEDGLDVYGGALRSGRVDGAHDHRVSMAFLVAGGAADGDIVVTGCDYIRTSFPNFTRLARSINMRVERLA